MEEEELETRYDGNVFARLFAYVKPHAGAIAVCLALVLAITALDLYRPILIGGAIDTYIEDYGRPWACAEPETAEIVLSDGLALSRDTAGARTFALVLYAGDRYYLAAGLDAETLAELQTASEAGLEDIAGLDAGGALSVRLDGETLTASPLSRDDLALLRAEDARGLARVALAYLLVLTAGLVCRLVENRLLQRTGQAVIFTIRQELFEHIHTLPLRYFDTNPVGRIVTRVTNDVESLNQMYSQVLVRLFSNTVLIIGYAVVMVRINPRLALLSFAFLPAVFALTLLFRTLVRRIYRITRTRVSALNTFLSENISGMKLIELFAREREKAAEFRGRTGELYQSQMREVFTFAVFRPGLSFLSNVVLALILWRSARGVLAGTLTLGTMYIFTNYIRSFFEPIQELAEQFSTLQNAMASAEKIFTVLDEENTITEPETPAHPDAIRGGIEFQHVWFAYDGKDYVLRDVSFRIAPGEKVAFVGATGAGKSSILNLVGRYYDIQKGRILIDGVDIRDLSTAQLRRAIGQVQQDVFIFTGDVKSNIRLLDDGITDEQLHRAAEAANADHFIDRLPGRYDEPVTERGSTLSAGERQLLSFARTLAHDPPILVMDEATANIDTETELLIQEALETLMRGRTTIMVAHRLSTVQHADRIYVMHKGTIRESGTHQELLQANGIYKKLYDLQQ